MAPFPQKITDFGIFSYFSAEMQPHLGKKSENQKFDGYNCGEAYILDLSQVMALEIDLELRFSDFQPLLKNKNLSHFPIQIGENTHIVANFVASYLCNRTKLRDK